MANWNGTALRSLSAAIGQLAHPDPRPLLVSWCKIISEDSPRGLLAGQDKDGNPMVPVTYRPIRSATKKSQKWTKAQQAAKAGSLETAHNNLTSAQYRRLAGPPLVPRGRNSRLITNLYVAFLQTGEHVWRATGAWAGIISAKGVAFMPYHFDGVGRLPKRDPCGVRPWGVARAQRALNDWTYAVLNAFHRQASA
jgi:hypothetical protein